MSTVRDLVAGLVTGLGLALRLDDHPVGVTPLVMSAAAATVASSATGCRCAYCASGIFSPEWPRVTSGACKPEGGVGRREAEAGAILGGLPFGRSMLPFRNDAAVQAAAMNGGDVDITTSAATELAPDNIERLPTGSKELPPPTGTFELPEPVAAQTGRIG